MEGPRERDFDFSRTVALSDGVFAIALTLLVLNIHEPSKHGSIGSHFDDLARQIGAYILSFAVLAWLWARHHQFFRGVRMIDSAMAALNLVYLCFVAFIPFPTMLLSDRGDDAGSVALYAATIAGVSLIALAMRTRARRAGLLTHEGLAQPVWQSLAPPAVFLVSIPIAFASTSAATWFWALLLIIPVAMRRRRA